MLCNSYMLFKDLHNNLFLRIFSAFLRAREGHVMLMYLIVMHNITTGKPFILLTLTRASQFRAVGLTKGIDLISVHQWGATVPQYAVDP